MMSPLVFNVFKPTNVTSYDVIRVFKRGLPKGFGKIGHFGTLDPFACGVLLIGIGGATRINNLVHDCHKKTYLAIGKLGISTDSGDRTGNIVDQDPGRYLRENIARFDKSFIEKQLQQNFLGEYYQSPPTFSAAKFQGKALHQWAREGVVIKKEPVRREVYRLEVVKYAFPYLSLRVEVSSGTYIRTLFEDCAKHLGTYGHLISLVRESIGHLTIRDALKKRDWPSSGSVPAGFTVDQVLPLKEFVLSAQDALHFRNGGVIRCPEDSGGEAQERCWVYDQQRELIGMGHFKTDQLAPKINFSTVRS